MLQRAVLGYGLTKRLPVRRCLSNSRQLSDSDEEERRLSPTLKRIKAELESDKQKLKWRPEIGDRPGDWNSKFKLFANMETTSDFIVLMQKPIDLSPKAMKAWWKNRQLKIEKHMQQYVPQRVEILGHELAAAHFLLYRGAAVRFTNSPKWMRADENGEFDLPNKYAPGYYIEAIRCDNMRLHYEGLENIRHLSYLKFLSLHNVKTFDDWCLDRVSGSQFNALEVLDISGTLCTVRGLSCLYRLPKLQLLIVDNPKESLEYELTCAMLCESMPQLKIVGADAIHDLPSEEKATSDSET